MVVLPVKKERSIRHAAQHPEPVKKKVKENLGVKKPKRVNNYVWKTDNTGPSELSWKDLFDDIEQNKGITNMENNEIDKIVREELEAYMLEKKKKKACKPSKGKRFAKRVDGKCRSFGQKGQAKGGGDRIRPGTKKGDAYCARSAKIKKCKNPPCANDLSRKKWKCRGSKSVA